MNKSMISMPTYILENIPEDRYHRYLPISILQIKLIDVFFYRGYYSLFSMISMLKPINRRFR